MAAFLPYGSTPMERLTAVCYQWFPELRASYTRNPPSAKKPTVARRVHFAH